jgi:putative DNA primase/helicase
VSDIRAAALAAYDAGLCPIRAAADGTKAPLGRWKRWQNERPERSVVEQWFANGHQGMGAVCGGVSGGLEMVELEGRAIHDGLGEKVTEAMDLAGIGDLWDRIIAGYLERTPSGGFHALWRCETIDGNLKLGRRPATAAELAEDPDDKVKVLIETRGEGGFTILAPSNGTTHPTGKPWELAPTLHENAESARIACSGVAVMGRRPIS